MRISTHFAEPQPSTARPSPSTNQRGINDQDRMLAYGDCSARLARHLVRKNLEYQRTDRSDAKEVREVVVQDCDLRSGNNELPTGWNVEGRNVVRGDVSARQFAHRLHANV